MLRRELPPAILHGFGTQREGTLLSVLSAPGYCHALYHVTSIIPALKDTRRHNIPSEHRAPSLPELFPVYQWGLMLCDGEDKGGGLRHQAYRSLCLCPKEPP